MNYIRELNAFYDWLETNGLSLSAFALWHVLMHIANKAAWTDEFAVAVSVLCAKTGLSPRAVYEARNELRIKGRLEWRSRKGNQSAVYRLIPLSAPNAGNHADKELSAINAGNRAGNHAGNHADKRADNGAPLNKLNETKLNNNNNTCSNEQEPLAAQQKQKIKYAEFVSMTNDEYSSLVAKLGGEERAKRCIEILDNYKGAKGKKYKSDYRAILNWVIDRLEEEEQKKQKVVNIHADNSASAGKPKSKYALPDGFYWSD